MIKYSLGCEKKHEFEGWFSSGAEFDRLIAANLVDCPTCGSPKINKLLMAPQINRKAVRGTDLVSPVQKANTPVPKIPGVAAASGAAQQLAMAELVPEFTDARAKVVEQIRDFKKKIIENSENVGDRFGEEARKIHYGEVEKRGIYGKATIEEAHELWEEGVDIMAVPELPEEKN